MTIRLGLSFLRLASKSVEGDCGSLLPGPAIAQLNCIRPTLLSYYMATTRSYYDPARRDTPVLVYPTPRSRFPFHACHFTPSLLDPIPVQGRGRPLGALGGVRPSTTRRYPSSFENPSSSAPPALNQPH